MHTTRLFEILRADCLHEGRSNLTIMCHHVDINTLDNLTLLPEENKWRCEKWLFGTTLLIGG